MARRSDAGIDITFLGDRDLQRRLKKLSTKLQKQRVQEALSVGAKVILTAAKANAPVLSGKMKAGLHTTKRPRFKKRQNVFGVGIEHGSRRKLGIDAKDQHYYPAVITFGTNKRHHIAPNPFFAQAFEAKKRSARAAILSRLRVLIGL